MPPRRRFAGTAGGEEAPPERGTFRRGHHPVSLRQVFLSIAAIGTMAWMTWSKMTEDYHVRRAAYFKTMRAHYIDANTGAIAGCVHNPLMTAPRPEMAAAYRNLYPFPEFQAPCRGGDDEVPEYLIERDRHYHGPRKELYFAAQRGLLDYLLFSTWEYRWNYHKDLFRADRRPLPQRRADAAATAARPAGAAAAAATGGGVASLLWQAFNGGAGRDGVQVLWSRTRRLSFFAFEAAGPASPGGGDGRGGGAGEGGSVEWTGWDEADLGLEASTKMLLFGYRPVGDVLAASRADCSEEVGGTQKCLPPRSLTPCPKHEDRQMHPGPSRPQRGIMYTAKPPTD